MKSSQEEAALFREECLKWQKRLNLLDWTLSFKTVEDTESEVEALNEYDCDTRESVLTYYLGVDNVTHPKDNALHEMLHLRLADMLRAAIASGAALGDKDAAEEDILLQREEHRAIAVLEKVLK